MPSLVLGRMTSDGSWDDSRGVVNTWLDGLLGNGPGYLRLTQDDGNRLHARTGQVLASGQYQTTLRSQAGHHLAVLLSGTDPATAPSPSNAVLLVDDTGLQVSGGLALSGNLSFVGPSRRILADFSNSAPSQRTLFQSSVGGGTTNVGAIPNGGGVGATWSAFGSSNPDNSSMAQLTVNPAAGLAALSSSRTGSAPYLPLSLMTSGTEQLRVDAAGLVTLWQNLAWFSGTANLMTFDHNATAPRTITFPDASGTVLLGLPPVTGSVASFALTGSAAQAIGLTLPPGVWLVTATVSWLPLAGDAGAIFQALLSAGSGATLAPSGPICMYTADANLQRASGALTATATVAGPASALVALYALKIGGTGAGQIEQGFMTAVRIG